MQGHHLNIVTDMFYRVRFLIIREVFEVDFIVVDAYCTYTAIVGRPWLHALGVVSSILHQKEKYPSGNRIKEIVGS